MVTLIIVVHFFFQYDVAVIWEKISNILIYIFNIEEMVSLLFEYYNKL